MVQLIVGNKGKGKTKYILDKANTAIKEANGCIVYLDKSSKHMYELNNKIRLIDVSVFPLTDSDEFVGFICGIISQNRDIEEIYLDSFLKLARLENNLEGFEDTILQLENIGKQFNVTFIISVSLDEADLSDRMKALVSVAL